MRKSLTALPVIALFLAGCAATPAATDVESAAVAEPIASPVATLERNLLCRSRQVTPIT
jgi:alkaline phosphatase